MPFLRAVLQRVRLLQTSRGVGLWGFQVFAFVFVSVYVFFIFSYSVFVFVFLHFTTFFCFCAKYCLNRNLSHSKQFFIPAQENVLNISRYRSRSSQKIYQTENSFFCYRDCNGVSNGTPLPPETVEAEAYAPPYQGNPPIKQQQKIKKFCEKNIS